MLLKKKRETNLQYNTVVNSVINNYVYGFAVYLLSWTLCEEVNWWLMEAVYGA